MTKEALIRVENLKKNFHDLEVLKGINEEIHEGEVAVSYTHLLRQGEYRVLKPFEVKQLRALAMQGKMKER